MGPANDGSCILAAKALVVDGSTGFTSTGFILISWGLFGQFQSKIWGTPINELVVWGWQGDTEGLEHCCPHLLWLDCYLKLCGYLWHLIYRFVSRAKRMTIIVMPLWWQFQAPEKVVLGCNRHETAESQNIPDLKGGHGGVQGLGHIWQIHAWNLVTWALLRRRIHLGPLHKQWDVRLRSVTWSQCSWHSRDQAAYESLRLAGETRRDLCCSC